MKREVPMSPNERIKREAGFFLENKELFKAWYEKVKVITQTLKKNEAEQLIRKLVVQPQELTERELSDYDKFYFLKCNVEQEDNELEKVYSKLQNELKRYDIAFVDNKEVFPSEESDCNWYAYSFDYDVLSSDNLFSNSLPLVLRTIVRILKSDIYTPIEMNEVLVTRSILTEMKLLDNLSKEEEKSLQTFLKLFEAVDEISEDEVMNWLVNSPLQQAPFYFSELYEYEMSHSHFNEVDVFKNNIAELIADKKVNESIEEWHNELRALFELTEENIFVYLEDEDDEFDDEFDDDF